MSLLLFCLIVGALIFAVEYYFDKASYVIFLKLQNRMSKTSHNEKFQRPVNKVRESVH